MCKRPHEFPVRNFTFLDATAHCNVKFKTMCLSFQITARLCVQITAVLFFLLMVALLYTIRVPVWSLTHPTIATSYKANLATQIQTVVKKSSIEEEGVSTVIKNNSMAYEKGIAKGAKLLCNVTYGNNTSKRYSVKVTVHARGRLGNNMCQYATIYLLGQRECVKVSRIYP